MASHSSILAWKIPWTEEPGELRSRGSQRVRHDWAHSTHKVYNVVFDIYIYIYSELIPTIYCEQLYYIVSAKITDVGSAFWPDPVRPCPTLHTTPLSLKSFDEWRCQRLSGWRMLRFWSLPGCPVQTLQKHLGGSARATWALPVTVDRVVPPSPQWGWRGEG